MLVQMGEYKSRGNIIIQKQKREKEGEKTWFKTMGGYRRRN